MNHIKWILILHFFVFTVKILASDYYVDQNHPSSNDQNIGTIEHPWKTITKANQTLIPGDTVFIRAGTYNSYIAPVRSGKSDAAITYKNFQKDTVTIKDTSYGIFIHRKSYIIVQGINFYNLDKFLWITDSATHNIISYCTFEKARNLIWSGSKIDKNSSHNWVHHCRFSGCGFRENNLDRGTVLDIGDEYTTEDYTSRNLIEDNIMFHGGHHIMGVYGKYNVIRNNYFHNEPWSVNGIFCDQCGNRDVMFGGYINSAGRNLFERNQVGYGSNTGLALTSAYNIVRFNWFYYSFSAGLSMTVTSSYISDIIYNKIYHNSFFHNGIKTIRDTVSNSGIYFALYSGPFIIKHNTIKNNIIYSHKLPFGTIKVDLADQVIAGNWNGDTEGDPKFVNAGKSPGDPMIQSYPDLRIQPGSPCIDKGTFLTTITSAGGSGNSFIVADAGYFMDGWGIKGVQGDEIQLFRTSQRARITNVNYSTGFITLDREVTWKQNQGISLAYKKDAPDIGAFEY